jgi:aerobic carbon-monoxide dehydrogenase small subunit
MNEKFDITLNINGQDYPIRVEARKTLVDAIRDDCGQTGTHIGCEHGVCGTCTVIVNDEAVRSCLMFAVQAQGKPIRTVEGLANGDELSVLQRSFIENHGLQCGYCTPGMILAAVDLLRTNPNPTEQEVREGLEGNLCRCTGYVNIVRSVLAAAAAMREGDGAEQTDDAKVVVA